MWGKWIVVGAAVLALGCQQENVECSCVRPGVEITNGSHARDLALTGLACFDAPITSVSAGGGSSVSRLDGFVAHADSYDIMPKRGGDCIVYVAMDDGTVVSKTIAMRFKEGDCCGGAYPVDGLGYFALPTIDAAAGDGGP